MKDKLHRYSIKDRFSKVSIDNFSKIENDLISLIPNIEQGRNLLSLIGKIKENKGKKGLIAGFGAHLIKCGLSPIIIQLMKDGYITALATNGASIIHDFEIAYEGRTSEDVQKALKTGAFGMAYETCGTLNAFFQKAVDNKDTIQNIFGKHLENNSFEFKEYSIFYWAYKLNIPISLHIAIGTDIIHFHPEAKGEYIGKISMDGFWGFIEHLKTIKDGGIYLNIGSAVILPEVFLKALSYLRNTDSGFGGFTTAVFDFNMHYRPLQNVVNRPRVLDSEGYYFIGSHEILIPLLYYLLKKL